MSSLMHQRSSTTGQKARTSAPPPPQNQPRFPGAQPMPQQYGGRPPANPYQQMQMPPPQYAPMQQFAIPQQMQDEQQQHKPTIIRDFAQINEAIGFTTIRLSRVETRLQMIEEQDNNGSQNDGFLISKPVFDALMEKVALLEKQVYHAPPSLAHAAPSQDVTKLKHDVDELRAMVMNMQSYTMDVTKRLVDMVIVDADPCQATAESLPPPTPTYDRNEFDAPPTTHDQSARLPTIYENMGDIN